MSDIVSVRRRADSLETSSLFANYSKVIINIDRENYVSVGDDSGRTLTINNPFGTEEMAQNILSKLEGYQYQPYESSGASLDPAAEIGDGVTIGDVYGGIYQRRTDFSRLMKSDISAPQDKEINHEYHYTSPSERQFERDIGDVKASLLIQSNEISAKVSQTNNNESFGWELLSDHWSVLSNGREVLRVDDTGGTFSGSVVASSGKIANFNISASAIWNNLQSFGGSQSTGVYVGVDGIQLGQGFKVTPSGNMTLGGTLNLGGVNITPYDLVNRTNNSYSWVSGNGSYCLGGASYGFHFGNATVENTTKYPAHFRVGKLTVDTINVERITSLENLSFRGGNVYTYTSGGIKYLCVLGGN